MRMTHGGGLEDIEKGKLDAFMDARKHLYYTGQMAECDNIARYINSEGRMCAYLATGAFEDTCDGYHNRIIRVHSMGHVLKAKDLDSVGIILNMGDVNYRNDKANCNRAGISEKNIFELTLKEMEDIYILLNEGRGGK